MTAQDKGHGEAVRRARALLATGETRQAIQVLEEFLQAALDSPEALELLFEAKRQETRGGRERSATVLPSVELEDEESESGQLLDEAAVGSQRELEVEETAADPKPEHGLIEEASFSKRPRPESIEQLAEGERSDAAVGETDEAEEDPGDSAQLEQGKREVDEPAESGAEVESLPPGPELGGGREPERRVLSRDALRRVDELLHYTIEKLDQGHWFEAARGLEEVARESAKRGDGEEIAGEVIDFEQIVEGARGRSAQDAIAEAQRLAERGKNRRARRLLKKQTKRLGPEPRLTEARSRLAEPQHRGKPRSRTFGRMAVAIVVVMLTAIAIGYAVFSYVSYVTDSAALPADYPVRKSELGDVFDESLASAEAVEQPSNLNESSKQKQGSSNGGVGENSESNAASPEPGSLSFIGSEADGQERNESTEEQRPRQAASSPSSQPSSSDFPVVQPEPTRPILGTLIVDATPWARITAIRRVGGAVLHGFDGVTTPARLDLPPGVYEVELGHPDLGSEVVTVEVRAERTVEASATLQALDAAELLSEDEPQR